MIHRSFKSKALFTAGLLGATLSTAMAGIEYEHQHPRHPMPDQIIGVDDSGNRFAITIPERPKPNDRNTFLLLGLAAVNAYGVFKTGIRGLGAETTLHEQSQTERTDFIQKNQLIADVCAVAVDAAGSTFQGDAVPREQVAGFVDRLAQAVNTAQQDQV